MNDYVVSAIKYRPQCFDDVVGQSALTSTLKSAIKSGKLAHSYLFCGPRGVGKTTCARIFAKTINCKHIDENGEACNECDSCVAFNEGRSLNVHEIDAASNNSVDNIRDLIDQVGIPPQMGRYKVFIIDEVHMLSTGAFNAFLKTLEEPPSYAIFILATTEKQKIIPTILSRCQIYDFKRIETDDIVYQLTKIAKREGFSFEDDALRVIAEKADGGMRDALSLFDQQAVFTNGNIGYEQVIKNLNILDYSAYFKIYDSILEHNIPKVLIDFNNILARGFDGRDFIDGLARHTRNLLMASDSHTMPLLQVSKHTAEQYRAQAQKCTQKTLYRVMKLCNDCSLNYRNSRNKQLLVEITLIEAAQADDDDAHAKQKPASHELKQIFSLSQQPTKDNVAAEQLSNKEEASTQPKTSQSDVAQQLEKASIGDESVAKVSLHKERPIVVMSSIKKLRESFEPYDVKETLEDNKKTTECENTSVEDSIKIQAPVPRIFDDSQFKKAWVEFSDSLPVEQSDLAARMKAMEPIVDEYGKVDVVCANQQVINFMQSIADGLCGFLRAKLNDRNIVINFSVSTEVDNAVSPVDGFKEAMVENLCLAKLSEGLNFEIL